MNNSTPTKVATAVAELERLDLPGVVAKSQEKFLDLFARVHGVKNCQQIYEVERYHFLKRINESEKLQACSKLSMMGCFLDSAVDGLSFDPAKKHCYLVPFGNKVTRMVSGYGELLLRERAGQIKYADNPKLVYGSDEFEYGESNGQTFLKHIRKIKDGAHLVACYLKIHRPDGGVDYKVLTFDELMDLRKFSKDPDSLAWTKGIAGMFSAKTIKHAFKNYPKPTLGSFSNLETQEEIETAGVVEDILAEGHGQGNTAAQEQPAETAPANLPELKPSMNGSLSHDAQLAMASAGAKPLNGRGVIVEDESGSF